MKVLETSGVVIVRTDQSLEEAITDHRDRTGYGGGLVIRFEKSRRRPEQAAAA